MSSSACSASPSRSSAPTASSTPRLRHRLRPRRQDRRRPVPGHRRPLLRRGREPHPHRTPRKGRRCHDAARRCLQAPHLPYAYQGMGPAGLDLLCEASAELDMPIVTEIMDHATCRSSLTRRLTSCKSRPQRPELPPAQGGRQDQDPGPAQARHVRHRRRAAHGCRVHHERGQRQRSSCASAAFAPSRPAPATPSTSTPCRCCTTCRTCRHRRPQPRHRLHPLR